MHTMKELIQSNVYNENDSSELIEATLDHITSRLTKTLGPYGSTTLIADATMGHIVSKDGFTVLDKIKYNGVVPRTVLDIISKVSRSLVKEVGVGSTSAVVVSNRLYKGIYELKEQYKIAPKEILDLLGKLEEIITEDILENSVKIDENNFEKLRDIASISNNNDVKAGDVVYNLYKIVGAEGFINIEDSRGESDYYEVNSGIEFEGGYIDRSFATEKNRVDTIYERPYVLMCNDTIDENDMELIADMYGKAAEDGRPLVVIAKNYDFEMQNFFKINKAQNRNKFCAVPVMYPLHSLEYQDRFEDLAIYLGATIYNKSKNIRPEDVNVKFLGECDKFTCNEDKSTVVCEEISEATRDRIEELQLFIEENELDSVDKFKYKKRIAILEAKNAILYVGGTSQLEKETRKYLMEDAGDACQSTIRHGYISGGNLVIPRLIRQRFLDYSTKLLESGLCKSLEGWTREHFIEDLIDLVSDAFKTSYRSVLNNMTTDSDKSEDILKKCLDTDTIFNLITHEYENIDETTIINSVMTDAHIMKASFSIVGLLATSNQFITQEPCVPIMTKGDSPF